MNLEYVPLLQMQRDIYTIPRGFERFKEYIDTMRGGTDDMELPLVALNPMGKEHIPALLDDYLGFGADEIGMRTVAAATPYLAHIEGTFKVTLVIADDAHGQWTNRTATEFDHCFKTKPFHRRGWLVGNVWTSETPDPAEVQRELLRVLFRGAAIQENGYPEQLGAMMAQEGYASAMAGYQPSLDEDELAYTAEILAPYLTSDAYPIQVACLFGDEAAKSLGYEPIGLSANAGFALALHQAGETIDAPLW